MQRFSVRYVHKVAPRPGDQHPDIYLAGGCFSDSKTLGKALRNSGVLMVGARVMSFRVEGSKVVVFPKVPGLTTYWHSVILEAV